MGLSDIAVSKRLKTMGSGFYGRNAAYAAALDAGSIAELTDALKRNVYGSDPNAAAKSADLALYIGLLDAELAETPIEAFATGRFRYPEGSSVAGGSHD
jgi:cytochrome b pre-mRNA-processing protein 3